MTPRQHILIAAALGFPSCCIAEWVEQLSAGQPQGILRGGITAGVRVDESYDRLLPRITRAFDGDVDRARAWLNAARGDRRVHYVPCAACAALRDAGTISDTFQAVA